MTRTRKTTVVLLGSALWAAACFPGERPVAAHLICNDDGCSCEPGFDDCDNDPASGCETPTSQDDDNCGGCGLQCNSACNDSACVTEQCNDGFEDCNGDVGDGCEVSLTSDASDCGFCGHSCGGGPCIDSLCAPYELVDRGFFAATAATDDDSLYFCELISGTIIRAPLAGGDTTLLAIDQHCGFLDFDSRPGLMATGGGYLYWTTGRFVGFDYEEELHAYDIASGMTSPLLGQATPQPCCTAQGQAGCGESANIEACVCAQDDYCCSTEWDSTCAGEVVSLGCGSCETSPRAIVADDSSLLLTTADGIVAKLDIMPAGGGPSQSITTSIESSLEQAALAGEHAYWVAPLSAPGTSFNSAVYRKARDGSGEVEIFAFGTDVNHLSAWDNHIYWTERDSDDNTYVAQRRALAGGEIRELVVSERRFFELYPSDDYLYFSELIGNAGVGVLRTPLDSDDVSTLSESHYIYTSANHPDMILWADYSDRIYALAK